jgi:hypothetical protein
MPAGRNAARDVAVKARFRRVAFEELAPATAKTGAPGLVERKFARREQPDVLDRIERALRIDIERADRIDPVVVELDAVGDRASHRIQVDQPAAHAIFAGRDDLRTWS